jgi:hypothetical protein
MLGTHQTHIAVGAVDMTITQFTLGRRVIAVRALITVLADEAIITRTLAVAHTTRVGVVVGVALARCIQLMLHYLVCTYARTRRSSSSAHPLDCKSQSCTLHN